jgi:hypothetical protein
MSAILWLKKGKHSSCKNTDINEKAMLWLPEGFMQKSMPDRLV